MKRCLSILLTLLFVFSLTASLSTKVYAWDGSVASSYAGGDGSRSSPYIISTPQQLARFRDEVNGGASSVCAKVVNDIDLDGAYWTPIGLTQTGYTGVFDGGGWSIKNVYINSLSDKLSVRESNGNVDSYQVGGLFGVIGSGGMVKYVNISGRISGSIVGNNGSNIYIGALAGTTFGMIEECFSTCSITNLTVENDNYIGIGGITGISFGKGVVRNCYNVGAINVKLEATNSKSNNHYIGGIVGYSDGETYNCYSAAPINVDSNSSRLQLGGIIGVDGGNFVKNCHFDRQVCTTTSYVAGNARDARGPHNPKNSTAKDTSDMKTTSFVSTLGNSFAYDKDMKNNGYPILAVMTYGEVEDRSAWAEAELTNEANKAIYQRLYPTDLYSKDLKKQITRTEFAAVAVKLYEELGGQVLDVTQLTNPFYDTTSDPVVKAAAIGIVAGVSKTEFNPYAPITRQDMCTMLFRVYKSLYMDGWTLATDASFVPDYSGVKAFADDAQISGYAKPAVYFMAKNNIVSGLTAMTFAPQNTTSTQAAQGYADATREQSIVIVVRMFNFLQKR